MALFDNKCLLLLFIFFWLDSTETFAAARCPTGNSASTTSYNLCQATTTNISSSITYSGTTSQIVYQWFYNTTNSTNVATAISAGSNTSTTSASPVTVSCAVPNNLALGTYYFFCVAWSTSGTCGYTSSSNGFSSNLITVNVLSASSTLTWNGSTSNNWATASNWTPSIAPTSCYNIYIPNVSTQPSISSSTAAICSNLTIDAGATLTIQSNNSSASVNLSLYGNLINNGTINYTGSQTRTSNFLQLFSTSGTISGTGTYSNLPVFFNDGSSYTLNNDMSVTALWIGSIGTGTSTLTLNCSNFNISTSIDQNGTWNLGSTTVKYSGGGSSGTTAPTLTSSRFNSQTSTFYYNSTSNNQFITDATYYNLKANVNSIKKVQIGTAGQVTCNNNFDLVEGTSISTGFAYLNYSVAVLGNLTIGNNCTLDSYDQSSADFGVLLGGTWYNNGSFLPGRGRTGGLFSTFPGNITLNPSELYLYGTSNQSIGGTSSSNFYNLTINKSAGSVQLTVSTTNVSGLTDSIRVDRTLTLSSGTLDLNGRALRITRNNTSSVTRVNGSVLSETTDMNSKIKWNVSNNFGTYIFPFSYNGTYIPFSFQLTSEDAGYVSLATYHTPGNNLPLPPTVNHILDSSGIVTENSASMVDRFWQIDKTGATASANITFTYDDGEKPSDATGGAETELRAQRWADNTWKKISNTGTGQVNDGVANTVTVYNVTKFSPWAIAKSISPLPVTLLSFSSIVKNDYVELNWETASEINNDKFILERSSNSDSFTILGTVKGSGTSSLVSSYNYSDSHPLKGINYYRLNQVDYDGKSNYSRIISAFIDEIEPLKIFVNHEEQVLNLSFHSVTSFNTEIQILDIRGKEIIGKNLDAIEGNNNFKIDLKSFKPGVYIVNIIKDGMQLNKKFIF